MGRGDWSDAEWEQIGLLLPSERGAGRDLLATTVVYSAVCFTCCA